VCQSLKSSSTTSAFRDCLPESDSQPSNQPANQLSEAVNIEVFDVLNAPSKPSTHVFVLFDYVSGTVKTAISNKMCVVSKGQTCQHRHFQNRQPSKPSPDFQF
jgi:hypothetical protein